ncbi:Glucose-repressible alcohol dehydrogenase transcriptional effector [Rhizina undulata]
MADAYAQQAGNLYTFQHQRLRKGTPPQTPSPSRSPAPQSPGYLYHQNQQAHQHAMMNTQSHRNFLSQPNMNAKFFQQLSQPQHSPQVDQNMNHITSNAVNNSVASAHQHAFTSAGLANANFSPQHVAGGTSNAQSQSQHWQEQQNLVANSRNSSSPHHHARTAALLNKNSSIQAVVSGGVNPNSYHPINGQHRKDGPTAEQLESRKNESGDIERQDWKALDLGGQGLRALSNALFQYTFLDKLYINHNKLTKLPSAIGRLKLLQYLDASGNQLTELPPELGMLTNLKQLLIFDNQLTVLPYELGSLYQLETLGIEGNPLQDSTKQIMIKEGTRAVIVNLRETMPIALPPVERDWIVLDDNTRNDAKAEADKFQVLCYNILCDKYATQNMYGYAPSWTLSWEYRRDMIRKQLIDAKSDIICLQEVDLDNFNEFFMPELALEDYRGAFYPKSRAKTMSESEKKTVDGCATFFKSTKFTLLDKQVIDFSSSAIQREDMKKTADIYNRVMPKDNIAVITFLENKATGSRLIVANVHIFWDPQYKDVKLVQVAMLMEELTKLAGKWVDMFPRKPSDTADEPPPPAYTHGSQLPLIICGDFNSIADSGVYELLSRGAVACDHDDLTGRTYGNFTKDGMSHPFSLKSSYANIGELAFTNYTPTFTGVIDYIWYTTNNLNVSGLLGDVDTDYLARVPGFPNVHFPSDHILLHAEFQVKPRKEVTKPPPPDFGNSSNNSKK